MNTNPDAVRVLCFGDSLTWGYIPGSDHRRFPADVRWTGQLQNALGSGYEVIEEGLNSRSLGSEDCRPGKGGRTAKANLNSCLYSHDPIDFIVLMLGTNELKYTFNNSPDEIGKLMGDLIRQIQSWKSQFTDITPKIIVMSPPAIDENRPYTLKDDKYKNAHQKSLQLDHVYREITKELGVGFISLANLEVGEDGVHPTLDDHRIIAKLLVDQIVGTR